MLHRPLLPLSQDACAFYGDHVVYGEYNGAVLDLEPGTSAALLALEQAVADRPEFFPLATQLHLLATT